MKKDVMLEIKGIQKVDGESDEVELTTRGEFSRARGNYYIRYRESELTGMENVTTLLKIEGDRRVTMTRSGNLRSQLIVEKGMRHQCLYDMGFDSWVIGVVGDSIEPELSDNGGNISFKYTLDLNTAVTSENEIRINIREAGIPNA